VCTKVKRRQHGVRFPSLSERFGKAPPLDGLYFSHLLEEAEHFRRWRQEQVAKYCPVWEAINSEGRWK
jgi:hypothetical protein